MDADSLRQKKREEAWMMSSRIHPGLQRSGRTFGARSSRTGTSQRNLKGENICDNVFHPLEALCVLNKALPPFMDL